MWKYFPTEFYKRYAKAEESAFEIVQEIIAHFSKEGLKDDGSPLMTILAAKGLDEKERITGVVGEFSHRVVACSILSLREFQIQPIRAEEMFQNLTSNFM